jgi:radical SAM family uncharacterized protein/radical SAM-linked protein
MISLSDLHPLLMRVEYPGRYVGGEFGSNIQPNPGALRVALCFPDLYEIGMSNYALRLLYKMANDVPGVSCERVFAPAPDFRETLKEAGIPLFTLESRTPLSQVDLIAVTIGYELAATTLVGLLESGQVEPLAGRRGAPGNPAAPLMIGGGPGTANPAPWSPFFDGLFLGEAEGVFPEILASLAEIKRRGGEDRSATREEQISVLKDNPHVWVSGKPQRARRAVWRGFGKEPVFAGTPIPSQRVVHDHGVVEIMRGCPQGCRFCSAGVYYRPYRMKDVEVIDAEIAYLVDELGYREITLSSLSSGDYRDIFGLFRFLNEKYGKRGVSFSLPSLRVNSLTLPLLAEISRVRRSGLTFAVETPTEAGQLSINKLVPRERTREVLSEAVEQGWKLAKFYFMIGLPGDGQNTPEEIAEHLAAIRSGTKVQMNVTVTTFVPKPHTPFQWARQLPPSEAESQLRRTKQLLTGLGIKMGYPDPFTSALEGVISRGDRRVGDLILAAAARGCYLDPWDEHFRKSVWQEVIETAGWDVFGETLGERSLDAPLPWDDVSVGVAPSILKREYRRSLEGKLTEHCAPECREPCGVCNRDTRPRVLPEGAPAQAQPPAPTPVPVPGAPAGEAAPRDQVRKPTATLLLSFRKIGPAAYLPHLSTMALFERAFQRGRVPVAFTEGFNPKPRLQFAQPLSVGIASEEELALVLLSVPDSRDVKSPDPGLSSEELKAGINAALPAGFAVTRAALYPPPSLRLSLMSLYWGGDFRLSGDPEVLGRVLSFLDREEPPWCVWNEQRKKGESALESLVLRYSQDGAGGRGLKKTLRSILEEDYEKLSIHRVSTLARGVDGTAEDYFTALAASQSFSSSSALSPSKVEPPKEPSIDLKRR